MTLFRTDNFDVCIVCWGNFLKEDWCKYIYIFMYCCERRELPSQYGRPKKRNKIFNIGRRTVLYKTFSYSFSILNWFQTWTGPARPGLARPGPARPGQDASVTYLVTLFRSLFLSSYRRYEFLLLIAPRATL